VTFASVVALTVLLLPSPVIASSQTSLATPPSEPIEPGDAPSPEVSSSIDAERRTDTTEEAGVVSSGDSGQGVTDAGPSVDSGAAEDRESAAKPLPESDPEPRANASGPVIELAPDDLPSAETEPPIAAPPQRDPTVRFGTRGPIEDPLLRGLAPYRRMGSRTVIGGYGQFNVNSLRTGPASVSDFQTRANLRRLVLFVAAHLSDKIELYTEFEWENAIACQSCNGSVEVEQSIIDWHLYKEAVTLRAGLVLVPMGIINQWHEPPIFNGVDRPSFDSVIIPSTWRELGVGFTGRFLDKFQYELYVTTPLDPTRMGPDGFISARTLGSLARADSAAVTGRLEYEPILGLILGGSFYASDVGPNGDFYDANGNELSLHLPIAGYEFDARIKRIGIEARVIWSQFFMPNAADLMQTYRENGSEYFPNVATTGPIPLRTHGGYVEFGYDVLFPFHKTSQAFVPFVRAEMYDTQAKVPQAYEDETNPALDVQELTMGVSYRPIPNYVLKFDVQLRDRRLGYDDLQINGGMGFMF